MIRELLEDQRKYLEYFFQHLDREKAEAIFQRLLTCKGTIVVSGVGKSGHIAQKIAATLLSTGTKAFYLDPTHAAHGDLGYVGENDIFLAFSKSGESQELLYLVPYIRKRKAVSIAIVSKEPSRLAKLCDDSILLPVQRELCPYDFAPTTSMVVQLLFGDCMAMALMRQKNISLDDYAQNHPGGFIGKRISLKVCDVMLRGESIPLCRPEQRLIDALHELTAKKCGCLLVVDEERNLKGIFTDGDMRRSIQAKGPQALETCLNDLMTPTPLAIDSERLAWDAVRQMEGNPSRLITVLPVLENGRVVGLLRMHDILQAGL